MYSRMYTFNADGLQRRIYVVLTDDISCGKVKFQDGLQVHHDKFSWSDLTQRYKVELQSKKLKLLGENYTLENICDSFEASTGNESSKLLKHLEGTMISNLLQDSIPIICRTTINVPRDEYIPRFLMSRRHISRRILEIAQEDNEENEGENGDTAPTATGYLRDSTINEVLVFKNVELYDLQLLVKKYGNGNCDYSSNIINSLGSMNQSRKPAQNILLQRDEDFEALCRMTNYSVHVFNYSKEENNKSELTWEKSRGSLASLHMFMHSEQKKVPESELTSENSTEPVLLADSAGTGKSTLMKKWANDMIGKGRFVQYIVMTEFINEFFYGDKWHNIDEYDDSDLQEFGECELMWDHLAGPLKSFLGNRIINAICKHSAVSKFEQFIVRTILCTKAPKCRIEIFFDGLDEIHPSQRQLAKLILGYFISRKQDNVRAWIATRPDLLEEFEEDFGVLGYTLQPFGIKDPKSLLLKYWFSINQDDHYDAKLREFAKECLQMVEENMSAQEKLMVGKPLICRLLSYVYQDTAKNFASSKDNSKTAKSYVTTFTLTQKYTNYIEAKLKKTISGFSKRKLLLGHMFLAMKLLYPRLLSYFVDVFPPYTDNLSQAILSIGLVEKWKKYSPPRFIHRTLAEYFVAATVKELLNNVADSSNECNDNTVETIITPLLLLLSQIFTVESHHVILSALVVHSTFKQVIQFQNHNICYFLTHLLQNKADCNLLSRIYLVYLQHCMRRDTTLDSAKSRVSIKCWIILNAAIVSNFTSIANWANECLKLIHSPMERSRYTDKFSCSVITNQMFIQTPSFNDIPCIATKYGDKRMLESICNFFHKWTNNKVIDVEESGTFFPESLSEVDVTLDMENEHSITNTEITLLHIAVESGDNEKVDYLLEACGYRNVISQEKYGNLFDFCVLNTTLCEENAIKKRKSILNSLGSLHNGAYFKRNAYFRAMSLMVSSIHFELLIDLLEKISFQRTYFPNFVCNNNHGQNIYHLLPTAHYDKNMTAEKYHEALVSLEPFFKYSNHVPQEEEYPRKSWPKEEHEEGDDTSEENESYTSDDENLSEHSTNDQECLNTSFDTDSVFEYQSDLKEHENLSNKDLRGTSEHGTPELFGEDDDDINNSDRLSSGRVSFIETEEEESTSSNVSYGEDGAKSVSGNTNRVKALKMYLESVNSAGWTPIHVAVSCLDLLDKTLDFFEENDISLNLPDHRGSTCIFKAVAGHRSPEFIRRLIRKGGNVKHRKKKGEHLLHVAAAYYNFEAVQLLINEFNHNVDVTDADGNTPLHVIFRTHNRGIYHGRNVEVEIEPNNLHRIIRFLIEHNADINKANDSGQTPFDLALKSFEGGDEDIFKTLTNPNLPITAYSTLALKGIIMNSRFGSIWHPNLITPFAEELIFKWGADVSQTDENGATLLHLAARAHSIGVKFLIEKKLIDANVKDSQKQTALMYMECFRNPDKCKIYNCKVIRTCLMTGMKLSSSNNSISGSKDEAST